MRILVALPPFEVFSPETGGAISSVTEGLGRAWVARGHQVRVTTPAAATLHRTVEPVLIDYPWNRHGAVARRFEAKVEGRLRRFDWPAYRMYVEEVKRAVRLTEPDCLVVHNDLVLTTLRLPIPASRVVVHLHNQVNVKRLHRARRALGRTRRTVAVSEFIAEDARTRFGAEGVTVIRNGVDVASFSRARAPRPPGSPLRVAFLGRLLLAKGPHVLLEAATQLADAACPVAITVIGSPTFDPADDHSADPYVREVIDRVERVGGTYLPHLDRSAVADQLADQDVVVVPSIFPDPFPLVLFEAMAAGCAVVASDIGGIPEAVAGVGRLFPAGDAAALADRLRELATDGGALERCVESGRARAAQRDWTNVAEEWMPVLDSLREP